jgi:RHS repeat-associated protein
MTHLPYGEARSASGTLPAERQFTGQRLDGLSGLYFYNARYYDAGLGRFASADSIVPATGNPQAWNRYSYVLNNPLRFLDPTGHYVTQGETRRYQSIQRAIAGGAYSGCDDGDCGLAADMSFVRWYEAALQAESSQMGTSPGNAALAGATEGEITIVVVPRREPLVKLETGDVIVTPEGSTITVNDKDLESYRVDRVDLTLTLPDGDQVDFRIREGNPRPPSGFEAWTIYPRAVVARDVRSASVSLTVHEAKHIEQRHQTAFFGFDTFNIRYAWNQITHGYRSSPYEVAAYGTDRSVYIIIRRR